jgi:hypothetical protein
MEDLYKIMVCIDLSCMYLVLLMTVCVKLCEELFTHLTEGKHLFIIFKELLNKNTYITYQEWKRISPD